MEIIDCLLDNANTRLINGRPIGERVVAQGKQHLWSERTSKVVDTIVLHYISAVDVLPGDPFNEDRILQILCDLGLSSHYLVTRSGTTMMLVPESQRAWHCGGSIMPEPDLRRDVNDFSIGVELVATASSGFTDRQYESCATLCDEIENRNHRRFTIVGHENVAGREAVALGLRADLKSDPGERFDWQRVRALLSGFRQQRALHP
jgi:N-acetyl-anhydromuramyl-L-alanine amidase AmpD